MSFFVWVGQEGSKGTKGQKGHEGHPLQTATAPRGGSPPFLPPVPFVCPFCDSGMSLLRPHWGEFGGKVGDFTFLLFLYNFIISIYIRYILNKVY